MRKAKRGAIGGLLAAVLAAGSMAAGPAAAASMAGPQARAAAKLCSPWAMADRVDRTGKMYGAGGVTCKAQVTGVLNVELHRNGKLARRATAKCTYQKTCVGHTKTITDSSGTQEWCARISFTDLWTNDPYVKWGCVTT